MSLLWSSGCQLLLALLLCLSQLRHASAQTVSENDWMDSSYTTEYRAASVVTNLWIAAFAVTSALFGLLGAVVALQWPNPRILCYKTAYSDMPSSTARSCCSLYSLNLGFCVFWLLVFAIMIIARDVVRIVVCLCFCLVHTAVVVVFRLKFKRFGRPERPYGTNDLVLSGPASGGGMVGAQPQAVGIPIYSIPMRTVVVGDPAADSTAAMGGQQQQGGSYWADAACMPPVQHPAMGAAVAPAAAPGAAATAAVAGAPVGGSAAVPFAVGGVPPAVLSQGSISYPPQPQSIGSPYASPYPAGPAAAAAAATGAAATAGYYAPYPQQMPLAAGPVVGVAIPAAAAASPAAAAGDAGSAAAAVAAGAAAAGGAAGAAVAAGAGASGGAAGAHSQQRQMQQ